MGCALTILAAIGIAIKILIDKAATSSAEYMGKKMSRK